MLLWDSLFYKVFQWSVQTDSRCGLPHAVATWLSHAWVYQYLFTLFLRVVPAQWATLQGTLLTTHVATPCKFPRVNPVGGVTRLSCTACILLDNAGVFPRWSVPIKRVILWCCGWNPGPLYIHPLSLSYAPINVPRASTGECEWRGVLAMSRN